MARIAPRKFPAGDVAGDVRLDDVSRQVHEAPVATREVQCPDHRQPWSEGLEVSLREYLDRRESPERTDSELSMVPTTRQKSTFR